MSDMMDDAIGLARELKKINAIKQVEEFLKSLSRDRLENMMIETLIDKSKMLTELMEAHQMIDILKSRPLPDGISPLQWSERREPNE